MSKTTASATSLNFIGFDEMHGTGTAPILFNRIVILPKRRETAGKWIHPAAGYVPEVWNKSYEEGNKRLARQGFKRVYNGYF